jgi:hypothetical protein
MWNHAVSRVAFYLTRRPIEKLDSAVLQIATSLCRISVLHPVMVNATALS